MEVQCSRVMNFTIGTYASVPRSATYVYTEAKVDTRRRQDTAMPSTCSSTSAVRQRALCYRGRQPRHLQQRGSKAWRLGSTRVGSGTQPVSSQSRLEAYAVDDGDPVRVAVPAERPEAMVHGLLTSGAGVEGVQVAAADGGCGRLEFDADRRQLD